MKRRLLAVTGALGLCAAACNALIGLDGFDKDECAHGCGDGGSDADVGAPDAPNTDAPNDAPPPPVPIPDGAAAVSWAQWPMPAPGDSGPNTFSYQLNGDASVTDKRTGLVWLPSKVAFGPDLDGFNQARAYCESRADAGVTWRLPTRIELVTLIDYSRSGPALDPGFTLGVTFNTGWYWSSSVVRPASIPYRFWTVNLTTGEVSNDEGLKLGDPRTVICVKS